MMSTDIRKIAVIGAGTMGGGIAQAAAQAGFEVLLEDVTDEQVKRGFEKIRERLAERVTEEKLDEAEKENVLSRIKTISSLAECSEADLIIEAAAEKEEVKKEIFKELDALCRADTLFASNTSSLSIAKLARATRRPARFAGMHFMNPPYIMKLVEIIKSGLTSDETVNEIIEVSQQMGKTPVVVNDSPGFIISRVLMTMINDAICCLDEGVALRDGIDTIMKLGAHHPMGPLELADLMGLDICLEILEILQAELGDKYRPCPLLKAMVSAGKLGRKSGEGFYEYR
jgi:3-hydroxybutyryl-CoA dehydrogenase